MEELKSGHQASGVRQKKIKNGTGVCALPSEIHCQFELHKNMVVPLLLSI
jgi:hypothetical protein